MVTRFGDLSQSVLASRDTARNHPNVDASFRMRVTRKGLFIHLLVSKVLVMCIDQSMNIYFVYVACKFQKFCSVPLTCLVPLPSSLKCLAHNPSFISREKRTASSLVTILNKLQVCQILKNKDTLKRF